MGIVSTHHVGEASCKTVMLNGQLRIYAVAAPDQETATALLRQVSVAYRDVPKIGPIGASTWDDYRVIKTSDGSPAFPGEPVSPEWMAKSWWDAGFNAIETYCSAIDRDPFVQGRRIELTNIKVSSWSKAGSRELLQQLHGMAEQAFAKARYFSPIAEEEFVVRFEAVLAGPAAEFSFVAMRDGEPVGFLVGYPDGRGGHVLKSLASLVPGLGSSLVDKFYRTVIKANSRYVIHALMHDDNVSLQMSKKFNTRIFRRYVLFGKDVTDASKMRQLASGCF